MRVRKMQTSYFRTIEQDFEDQSQLDLRARIALDLMRTYGLIAADGDGEDGGKRQKLKLQAPEEVVARCMALAETAVSVFEDRGYIKGITISREELEQQARDRHHRRLEAVWGKEKAEESGSDS